jgi:hypothetical protein
VILWSVQESYLFLTLYEFSLRKVLLLQRAGVGAVRCLWTAPKASAIEVKRRDAYWELRKT